MLTGKVVTIHWLYIICLYKLYSLALWTLLIAIMVSASQLCVASSHVICDRPLPR